MDNTGINRCKQCKDCNLRNDGTVWSNRYDKSSCRMYPYPKHKPVSVMNDITPCIYRDDGT